MVTCQHAASGCNYPQGECSGACLADKPQRRAANPHYLTIVYRITEPQQPRALLEHTEWRAASHTHAIQERDQLHAELNDVQDQRREAFRAIERLNDELGRLTEQRDGLLMVLKELLGPYVSKPCEITGMLDLLVCGEDINAARDAVAKTEGGAT